MNLLAILAAGYAGQLLAKAGLAWWVRRREPVPPEADQRRVTIVQPVMFGDERLEATLTRGLDELPGAAVIWVVDEVDVPAIALVERLRAARPDRDLRILQTTEPPPAFSPKTWKLAAALPLVVTEILAVVDDDTWMPRRSLDQLVAALDGGAALATGLPSYHPARGPASAWVAEFVNSAAILTYLSAAACAEPRSINGMGYALRTRLAREADLFYSARAALTDDLAVARLVQARGGRIVQTSRPQHISTTVTDWRHYGRLMHRWFVCTNILVRSETPLCQAVVLVVYGLHPLLLLALVAGAVAAPAAGGPALAATLLLRALVLGGLNRKFTGAWRHAPLASLAGELLQPVFLVGAWLHPVVWWRRRRIRVRRYEDFEYLPS